MDEDLLVDGDIGAEGIGNLLNLDVYLALVCVSLDSSSLALGRVSG